jgi:hypothetical protein
MTLVNEIRFQDDLHTKYFRMSTVRFDSLLEKIGLQIDHRSTHRYPITAAQRLAVTLRLLATGDSQQTVAFSYRMGTATVNKIFYETCSAICNVLKDEFLAIPQEVDWLRIASEFESRWNFPNCVGAIDGKHINIRCPLNSGSAYFNYKKTFSIVLMASVAADYTFTVIDIGSCGRESDGGVYSNSQFGINMEQKSLNLPVPRPLPGGSICAPFVYVGDEAFPLKVMYIHKVVPMENM